MPANPRPLPEAGLDLTLEAQIKQYLQRTTKYSLNNCSKRNNPTRFIKFGNVGKKEISL